MSDPYIRGVLDAIARIRECENQGADDIADEVLDSFCECRMGYDNMDLDVCDYHLPEMLK